MKKLLSDLLFALVWLISLLPMPVLYIVSDLIWLVMYICPPLRYRKKIVRTNLALSFPDKDKAWLRRTERRFYYQFTCQFMEFLKTASAGERWIKRHMEFKGIDQMKELVSNGQSQMCYMGHMGNWEWIPSMNIYFKDADNMVPCSVYHKLENEVMDRFILKLRGRYGSGCVSMEQIMRQLVKYKSQGKEFIVGMIADQVPMYPNIHYWTMFMNRNTPVFTGAERIARKMKVGVWYFWISRKSRGHYLCEMIPMFDDITDLPEYAITEKYMRMLQDNINESPELWLWTHNRWKRTWEGYKKWYERQSDAVKATIKNKPV